MTAAKRQNGETVRRRGSVPAHPSPFTLHPLLADHWSVEHLRPGQAEAIADHVNKCDSLIVMPTGAGKSLCYQVPALAAYLDHARVTIVVSPLIALQRDQVASLTAREIPAGCINSLHREYEQDDQLARLADRAYALFYVSPERLLQPGFLRHLARCRIDSFVIDEAHCIAQWGHDFRPSYGRLGDLRKVFPSVPIHAYTATATESVCDVICQVLDLRSPHRWRGTFDRPNLHLTVDPCRGVDRDRTVVEFARERADQSGIVYCITRAETERVAGLLQGAGVPALYYHGEAGPYQRRDTQDAFMSDECQVIVATVAFGMGVDKPNIRWILHAGMPSCMEFFHQAIGRAGRDGQRAECMLLWHQYDVDAWCDIFECDGSVADDTQRNVKHTGLHLMDDYCTAHTCRHALLAAHFDQVHTGDCGACDVCVNAEL